MATYTMYWPDWMCDRAREQGLEGQPLRLLWGGHNQDSRFSRFKVGPGDVVVPITAVDGVLFALGSLNVVEKTTAEPWVAAHPDDAKLRLHGCGSELLVGDGQGKPLRFDRAFSGPQLEMWTFDGTDGPRPLKFLEKGRLKKTMSLQGVYRVTEKTAEIIGKVLDAPVVEAPKTNATELEAALRRNPKDEQTARVLADAWQDAGDVRGEILALELDLAREEDPAKAAPMDERHAVLMRKSAGLKKQPGGFPFRPVMGARQFIEVSPKLTLAAGDKKTLLTAFLAFAHELIDTDGFASIELLRRPGLTAPPPDLDKAFTDLGAKRTAFVTWARKKPLSVDEVMGATGGDTAFFVFLEGALRGADGGAPLPFQANSQWAGSAPASELQLRLSDRAVWGALRVPIGTPQADSRAKELEAMLTMMGEAPHVRRLARSATGSNVSI